MKHDNQLDDSMERELGSLAPRGLSDGFVDRLGERMDSPTRSELTRSRQFGWAVWMAPAVAAAALIAVAIWFGRRPEEPEMAGPPQPAVPVESREAIVATAPMAPAPTLLAYTRAAGRDPNDLLDLLDQHAITLLPRVPDPIAFRPQHKPEAQASE